MRFTLYIFIQVSIEAYFPKPNSDVHVTSRSTPDRCFIAVNKRPVFLKEIDKVGRVRKKFCYDLCIKALRF